MIPKFPQFKKLELSDKQDVEKFTFKFPPYSDFNFISLWSWNIKDEMRLSILNDNLVVHFTNYLTGKLFYSFLGDNKINETVETLLHFSIEEKIPSKLFLIPDHAAEVIARDKFKVEEDLDNFDYIFDLNQISKYAGGQFMKKRNKIHQLIKLFPNIKVETINLHDENIRAKILKLDELWLNNKMKKDSNLKIKNELFATSRFFQSNFNETLGMGIFIDKELVGYSILSKALNNYVISHFTKADTKFIGIYDFLMKEIAKILVEEKYFFMNYEQDLGFPGLRESKKSFMSRYLRKFTVEFKN
jgi:hypothetical protein